MVAMAIIALNGLCADCQRARQLPSEPTERVCYGIKSHYAKPLCEKHNRYLLRSKFGDGATYYCPASDGFGYCSMRVKATARGGVEMRLLETAAPPPPRSFGWR